MSAGYERVVLILASVGLGGCVAEIDPSYGESYTAGMTTAVDSTGSTTVGSEVSTDDSSSGAPACDCGPWELCEAGICTLPARILFINLDGATTIFGAADASMDSHNLFPELEGTWAGYGGDGMGRLALLSALEAQWAPFRVVVTDQRPDASAAPYLMAVVTEDPPPERFTGTPWIAFPDCGDLIERDVAFVFRGSADGLSVQQHANTISQAIGRTFGLQRTNDASDINGSGDQFLDTCIARAEDPPCDAHDPNFCGGDATQQNAYRELEALLGLRG